MRPEIIQAITDAGFDVYMRDLKDTYCDFTDGQNIGYLQEGRFGGVDLSTVHIPNRASGTGYSVEQDVDIARIDAEMLSRTFEAPDWARNRDAAVTRKWPSLEAFLTADSWQMKLKLIAKGKK